MINYNGTLIHSENAILSAENRAFKYGDALFETLKLTNFSIHYIEDHYFRLMASMRMLAWKFRYILRWIFLKMKF